MDHDDVRAAMEIATVEPGGLDRLAAGDTGEAAAVAGHLAGCPACMDELTRLRHADLLLRPILATTPRADLRAQTLAYIRAVGRERGAPVAGTPMSSSPDVVPAPLQTTARRAARRAAWPAAVAAAVVVGLAGGFLMSGFRAESGPSDAAVALTEVSHESTALLGTRDAARVTLWDTAGAARGSIIVAPTAGRMVALAVDLPDPGTGREYRCWVEVGGARTRLGTMWLTGTVAWWNGPAELPANLGPGTRFGISLVTVGSGGLGDPVLTGKL
jgi:hypothetical protein